MEDKTLADWELEKRITNSDEIRTHLAKSRLTLGEPVTEWMPNRLKK